MKHSKLMMPLFFGGNFNRASQKFFECMDELVRAVAAQPTEEQEAEAA